MESRNWLEEYRHLFSGLVIREEDCDETRLAYHLPFLQRLDAIDGSSVALFDMRSRSYRFLTSSFKFLGGYSRADAIEIGPDYFFSLMHEGDRNFVLETVVRTFRLLFSVPAEERKDYKLSFEFSIRAATGNLVRVLQQVVVLELDKRGTIWLVLIANDLAPKSIRDDGLERRLINMKTGQWWLFQPPHQGNDKGTLSRRELEVLGLVANGMASREIAERLFISVATVNNHRQRILEKLGTRSSAEAVRYAAGLGLV
jgi:DNA-binding CsgD family transcriptional regulator